MKKKRKKIPWIKLKEPYDYTNNITLCSRFFCNWFHYLPWNNQPEKMGKSTEELLLWEKTGYKYDMIQNVLPYIKKYVAQTDSIPMIFAGDMNSLSHKDWDNRTKTIHNGLVVPWYSTKVLDELGLIDSYREINPNPGYLI